MRRSDAGLTVARQKTQVATRGNSHWSLLSDRKGNARYSLAVDPLERNKRVSDTPEKSDLGPETGTQDEHMKNPNRSTEHQKKGDARLPSDRLDRDQPQPEETIPRKSSLT